MKSIWDTLARTLGAWTLGAWTLGVQTLSARTLGVTGITGMTAVALASALLVTSPARADDEDTALLAIGAGYYDIYWKRDDATEFRMEYRAEKKFWELKPFAAVAGTTNGDIFVGAGVLMDLYVGQRWVVTPSLAPHYYNKGSSSKKDLGHDIEFRSQLEIAYQFDDRSRLGLSFSHYSNASLGDKNPGSETLLVNYAIPATTVTGWLE